MTQEALKLALEALEESKTNNDTMEFHDRKNKAITAIKEALAQTELCKYGQEPASCTSNPMDCQCAIDASLAQTKEPDDIASILACRDMLDAQPVPQRTWVGLTDEEMKELWENKGWYVTMYKAVEAKLKEKNT
jgi:hypothetical protein